MKEKAEANVPEFKSLTEEKEYWEARGPLAEGRKGRINRPKPGHRRSSFLAVRLTGEELTQLRDLAAKLGIGPSTLARLLLTSAIEHQTKLPQLVTLEQVQRTLENTLPQAVREKAEALVNATAIGDPDSPALIIIDGSQMKQWEEVGLLFFRALLSMAGVQVITPEDERCKEVRDILRTRA